MFLSHNHMRLHLYNIIRSIHNNTKIILTIVKMHKKLHPLYTFKNSKTHC